ncbi:hypothetical protein [Niameybacter massiliensis]|uniref:hypothetical protein n=1 Tax=Niameybacter massiliensis TaxID=1658108 RepID=UPI0012B53AF7|nr:hypothetical protein [Niameybacter massiliensis]
MNIQDIQALYDKLNIKYDNNECSNFTINNFQYPSAYENVPTKTAINTNDNY